MEKNIYNFTPEEILKKFRATEKGLLDEEAGKKLKEYGPNRIEKKQGWRGAKLILHQFNDALVFNDYFLIFLQATIYFFIKTILNSRQRGCL